MRDNRTPLVATAYDIPSLMGVALPRDLIGNEAATSCSEISTVPRGYGPSMAVQGAELFAGASMHATEIGVWDEASALRVGVGVNRKARDDSRGWRGEGDPFTSSGCHNTSRTWRRNSGSSSRKSTPWCASDTSPGIGMWPPPISPASKMV